MFPRFFHTDFSSTIPFSTLYKISFPFNFIFIQFIVMLRRKNQPIRRIHPHSAYSLSVQLSVNENIYIYTHRNIDYHRHRWYLISQGTSNGGVTFIPVALSIGLIQCQNSRLKSMVILRSGTVVESRTIYIYLITREMFAYR